jgi:hypothetical protein
MRFGRRTAAETPGSPLACEMFVHFVASVVSESRSTAHIIRIASEARAPPTAADVVMAATTAFGAALRHCIRASAAARARSLSAARAHGQWMSAEYAGLLRNDAVATAAWVLVSPGLTVARAMPSVGSPPPFCEQWVGGSLGLKLSTPAVPRACCYR